MSDVSGLLEAASAGDRQAAAAILPLVYDELRKLAAAKMANEKPDNILDATDGSVGRTWAQHNLATACD